MVNFRFLLSLKIHRNIQFPQFHNLILVSVKLIWSVVNYIYWISWMMTTLYNINTIPYWLNRHLKHIVIMNTIITIIHFRGNSKCNEAMNKKDEKLLEAMPIMITIIITINIGYDLIIIIVNNVHLWAWCQCNRSYN